VSRKRRIATITVAAAIVVVVSLSLFLLQPKLQGSPVGNNGTVIANAPEVPSKQVVSVVSARAAFPFVERWVSQYNLNENALANIEIGYYLDKPVAPSDLIVLGDIRQAANVSRNIPVSAQAAAVVYNIPNFPDIPSGLKLNSSLLSAIFNGTITKWNDPAVKNLNQNFNLPAENIIVVHENGNSSTLTLLANYLSTDTIKWPKTSLSVFGPDELAATIRKTPYSIGYVDFSYATQTRMTYAAIANQQGKYVLPSSTSIWQAVNSSMRVQNMTGINQTSNLNPPSLDAGAFGNSSYPLTGLYYVSLPSDMPNNARNATLDFVRWIIGDGQQTLSEVQYPSIYQNNEQLTTYSGAIINGTLPRPSKTL
jgi:phosphate transport system substrate-binding protein